MKMWMAIDFDIRHDKQVELSMCVNHLNLLGVHPSIIERRLVPGLYDMFQEIVGMYNYYACDVLYSTDINSPLWFYLRQELHAVQVPVREKLYPKFEIQRLKYDDPYKHELELFMMAMKELREREPTIKVKFLP